MSASQPKRVPRRGGAITISALLLMALVFGAVSFADAGGKQRLRKDEALVELGRRLFFDPTVSRSGKNSCASCHEPEHGFSDPDRVSLDDLGPTRRHSQPLLDLHLNPSSHWDGEFATIAELATARLRPFRGRRGKQLAGHSLLGMTGEGDDDAGAEERDVPEEDDSYGAAEAAPGAAGAEPEGTGGETETPDRPDDDDAGYRAPENEVPECRGGNCGHGGPQPPAAVETDEKSEELKDSTDEAKAAAKAEAEKAAEVEKARAAEEARWASKEEPTGPSRDEVIRERFDPTKLPRVSDVLSRSGRYDDLLRAAFGNTRVTTRKLAQAIEAYCLTIRSTEAPIDRYLGGQKDAISDSAKRGLALFQGRAGCAECHTMEGDRPTFSDFKFHNTGVSMHSLVKAPGAKLIAQPETKADDGRAERSKRPGDVRAFKTPTLRDLSRRGPYMHSGRFETLEQVVRYYEQGGGPDPLRSNHVKEGFKATDAEVADLVAFLETLTGDARPGLAAEPLPLRARSTKLRFVDARGRALAGLSVRLVPEGDVLPSETAARKGTQTVVTDRRGWIEVAPSDRTHLRVLLPDGLPIEGGALVPDSCRKAVLRVPVSGRTAVVLHTGAHAHPPATIVAEHLHGNVIPGHAVPRTVLRKTRDVAIGRTRVVRYEGWMRTDVPATVSLRLPGDAAGRGAPEVVLATDSEVRVRMP